MDNPIPPARQEYYDRIGRDDLAPLWEVLKNIVPREPKSSARAKLWRWNEVKPLLLEAGRVITAEEAERRVLVLENPAYRGQSRATPTIYAGLQLILPGEVARAHRHVAGAIRFILEGNGAYTAVDGERTAMHPGDFVITPSWTWHDHGHTGSEPVIWLDGLDLPIVNSFECAFLEHHEDEIYPQKKPQDDSLGRYAASMLPIVPENDSPNSPIINYRYDRSREALARIGRHAAHDAVHGWRLRYAHPRTGGWPTPTMGGVLSLLPKGFAGEASRQTDGQIIVCMEGGGRTEIGGQWFDWGPRDVFIVPNWTRFRHEAAAESVLFALSDRPAQEALNIWREARA
jgi:gentisate 1,2-dioxygenase